jgi:hypothetical protein
VVVEWASVGLVAWVILAVVGATCLLVVAQRQRAD